MPGTVKGGRKAARSNNKKTQIRIGGVVRVIEPGTFYDHIGGEGGRTSRGGGFAANRKLAREAGRKGGLKSRRPKLVTA